MNKKVKSLWIQALRSGEFRQIQGQLCIDDQYCVLGVLSVLSLVNGQCTYDHDGLGGRFDNRRYSLSFNTRAWAKITDIQADYMARLNDQGLNFEELAKIIEKEF